MKPVTPGSTISGTEPRGQAITGVPQDIASIITRPNGSVPEVVEPGVTGLLVDSIEQAADAVAQALQLDRQRVRQRFEERFSAARMAHDYLRVYRGLARHAHQLRVTEKTA